MNVFYGSAIQGNVDRSQRRLVHTQLIRAIHDAGGQVVSDHVTGSDFNETAELLEKSLGKLPPIGLSRTIYIRNRMIEAIEGDIDAAVFEVSVPSLGTGIELSHAYLRPRLGLSEIPILALYEGGYWPNNLSSMVRGLSQEPFKQFHLEEYKSIQEAQDRIAAFLNDFLNPAT